MYGVRMLGGYEFENIPLRCEEVGDFIPSYILILLFLFFFILMPETALWFSQEFR